MNQPKISAGAVLLNLLKAGCYLLLFLGSQTLVSTAYSVAVILTGGVRDEAQMMADIMAYAPQITLISAILTLAVLAVFFLLRRKHPLKEAGFRRVSPLAAGVGAAVTPAFYAIVIFVMSLLPQSWLESYAEASAGLASSGLIPFLATVVAAPIVEEVIFRGLVLSRLDRVMPGWAAVLISAALFGVCHGQIIWIVYAFCLGAVFGWMALRSRSLWPSLAAHFVFNLIGQLAGTLEGKISDWAFLGGLILLSLVCCLLTRKGLAVLFGRPAPISSESEGSLHGTDPE